MRSAGTNTEGSSALHRGMRSELPRLGQHVAFGVAAAASVGFADALIAIAALRPWRLIAIGAPWLGAAVMVPVGIAIGCGAYVFERFAVRRGPWPLLRTRIAGDREYAIWVAAGVLAFALVLALGALAAPRYVAFAQALQDETFSAHLSMFMFASGLMALVVLALALAWLLRAPLGRAWPRLAETLGGRFAFMTRAAAACVLAAPLLAFMHAHAALLGPLLVLPYAWLLVLVLALLWSSPLGALLAHASARRSYWIASGGAFLACAPLLSVNAALAEAFAHSTAPARVAAIFAHVTDVDGDGQSSVFGERDCAPFDARRSPLAYDAPDDHIDQDCDGRDARRNPGDRSSTLASELPLPSELVRKYNVVLIVIDALRGDRAPLVARKSLTPGLDRLAAESVVFTEAFSQSPSTRISFPSFLSGQLPVHLSWVRQDDWLQGKSADGMLAERLKRAGYRTGFVQNGWMHDKLPALRAGYDSVVNMRRPGGSTLSWTLGGAGASTRAIEFIEGVTRKPDPFFLTLYYDGPHAPYEDLREYGLPARSNHDVDRYEAEIRFVDQEAGHFLDYLRAKPKLWANTVVIVIADHGEEFREHGGTFHDRTCYRESTHVPLIVRVPQLPPAVARRRVALVNLVPTVLALTGISRSGALDGHNLLAADPAHYLATLDERVACTAFDDKHPNKTLTHALRDDHWLYVRHFGDGASEVYDTQRDPKETRNLIAEPEGARIERELRPGLQPVRTQ
jgi:arylsulfatase A-like enzyme